MRGYLPRISYSTRVNDLLQSQMLLTSIRSLTNFLFAVTEEEELESRSVVLFSGRFRIAKVIVSGVDTRVLHHKRHV